MNDEWKVLISNDEKVLKNKSFEQLKQHLLTISPEIMKVDNWQLNFRSKKYQLVNQFVIIESKSVRDLLKINENYLNHFLFANQVSDDNWVYDITNDELYLKEIGGEYSIDQLTLVNIKSILATSNNQVKIYQMLKFISQVVKLASNENNNFNHQKIQFQFNNDQMVVLIKSLDCYDDKGQIFKTFKMCNWEDVYRVDSESAKFINSWQLEDSRSGFDIDFIKIPVKTKIYDPFIKARNFDQRQLKNYFFKNPQLFYDLNETINSFDSIKNIDISYSYDSSNTLKMDINDNIAIIIHLNTLGSLDQNYLKRLINLHDDLASQIEQGQLLTETDFNKNCFWFKIITSDDEVCLNLELEINQSISTYANNEYLQIKHLLETIIKNFDIKDKTFFKRWCRNNLIEFDDHIDIESSKLKLMINEQGMLKTRLLLNNDQIVYNFYNGLKPESKLKHDLKNWDLKSRTQTSQIINKMIR